MLQKNLNLTEVKDISTWRKTAIGTWRATSDCTVYGLQKIEVSKVLNFIQKQNEITGKRITLTHFLGKACGLTLKKYPQLNRIIRFGKLYQRDDVSVFFHVASDADGKDLTGTVLHQICDMKISDIADELNSKTKLIKTGKDTSFEKSKGIVKLIPGFLMNNFLDLLGFIMYTLNIWTPLIGAPKNCFGSMMITNVGSLGVEQAFVPLVDYSRIPLILAIGKVYEDAYSENGQVKSGQFVNLNWTFDHRFIDGVIAAKMSNYIQDIFKNPENMS